ncbi:MAG: hypothetical protein V8T51_07310 [Senegalimassilia faecalis]
MAEENMEQAAEEALDAQAEENGITDEVLTASPILQSPRCRTSSSISMWAR